MPNYEIRIFDTTGALVHITDRFRSAYIEHRVNTPSTLTLSFYELDAAALLLDPPAPASGLDYIIQLRRRERAADLDWYTEYVGFHRTPQRQITTGDSRIFTSYSRGLLDLIRRRSIRYFGDVSCGLPDPTPADDVIKHYVRYNAAAQALVANGRASDGVTPGLTVQADTSQAADYQGDDQGKNLLEAIRDIGQPNLVDFDVVWGGPGAPTSFEFQTYFPQLGTDRRYGQPPGTAFVFSPGLGNMAGPSYTTSRTDEVTSAMLYGNFGDTTEVVSDHSTDSPWNLSEQDQDSRGEDRAAALLSGASKIIYDKRPAVNFIFDVLQTPSSFYAKHYFLGDLVTGRFSTVIGDVKIRAVSLTIDGNNEVVRLELEQPPAPTPPP